MKIYTAYDPPPQIKMADWDVTLTRQSEADACDINKIVSRYKTTGVLPAMKQAGMYADVSQMGDYRTAIEQVRNADTLFMTLPSEVRTKFGNDPALFLDFVSKPENKKEMIDLGLLESEGASAEEPPPEPEVDS